MFTLAHPWLLLLLPLPLLVRLMAPPFRETRPAVRSPWFTRLAEFAGATPHDGAVVSRRSRPQALGYGLVWCLLVLAMARPQYLEPPLEKTVPTRDLLLIVDLSGSMETEDFTDAAGQKAPRLDAVKEVLDDFLTRRKGDRVGLVVFGNAAFVQAPFTQDLEAVRILLDETAPRMAGPKTAFGDAIGLGITLFENSELPQRVMIALTDGNDTGSQVPPAAAARIAADRDIVIHTVAVGDPASVGEEKLDEEALQAVSKVTGGVYGFAGDRDQLEAIYTELDQLETRDLNTISHQPRLDLFHWPAGCALVLSLAAGLIRVLPTRRTPSPSATGADPHEGIEP